jgi:hypothetical protein
MNYQNQLNIHENALLRLMLERDELEYRIKWQDELIEMQRKEIERIQNESGINPITEITGEQPITSELFQKHIQQTPIDDLIDTYTVADVKDCLATLKAKADAVTARKLLFSYGVKQVADLNPEYYAQICQKSVIVLNEFLNEKEKGE